MKNETECSCGSLAGYSACCGRFIDGNEFPQTAEQLMRSRYTAYVRGNELYLLETWHASTRPATLALDSDEPVQWLGLRLLRVEQGGPNDDIGLVEFIARFKPRGRAGRLHENSRFQRENGRWYYVEGVILSDHDTPPVVFPGG